MVGFVGRLHEQKNPFRILDIFRGLSEIKGNCRLMLIGEGDLRESLIERCRHLGISDRVSFLGRRNDVNELMMAMDVFLMPSLYEGLPVVIVEAQATGLPCIISESVPAPDLTGRVHAFSLAADNSVWVKALTSDTDYSREAARQMVVDGNYDIHDEAEKLQVFYIENYSGE